MRRGLTWAGVILAATVVDLGTRFVFGLEFEAVLWIESLVFVVAALVLYRLFRSDPAAPGWRRGLQVVLIASFALAALRSAIWASGQPVTLANAIILVLGVVGWLVWRYRRKGPPAAAAATEDTTPDSPEANTRET